MASIIGNGQVKLDNGTIVNPQQGGWYDGQQFWGGTLSQKNQINSLSNQQGAGQQVSQEVRNQSAQQQNVAPQQFDNYLFGTPNGGSGNGTGNGVSGPLNDGGGLSGFSNPDVPNLPELYKSLYASKGINDIEEKLVATEKAYNENVTKINDNPWLSEANRTGRIQKLTTDYNNFTQGDRNNLSMKKADIETEIALQTKQFDINSTAASQALSQFNTLLQMGALDGADPNTIAQITRSTGLSSNAILSAINTQKQKNTPTSVIQYDDGSNQGFAVINTQTGDIISRQVIGASKPTKGSASATKQEEQQGNYDSLVTSVKNGITLKSLVNYYSNVLGIDDIYRIYNTYSPFGKAKESLAEIKQGKYKD